MQKHTAQWNYFEFDGLDWELFFYTDALKLKSLHYGYWSRNALPSVQSLPRAQQRYTDTLVGLIPPTVTSVLDVGCGIGDLAHALVQRGYTVTAISPDRNHAQYFSAPLDNLSFHQVTYEEFAPAQQYDLVLMSESQNYFDADIGLQQTRRCLKPSGYLLISGIFRKKDGDLYRDTIHIEREYLRRAHQHGFILLKRIDITERVLPTLVLFHSALTDHIEPVLITMYRFLMTSDPLKMKILRLFFGRHIRLGERLYSFCRDRTNPVLFQQECRYLRLLFRLT